MSDSKAGEFTATYGPDGRLVEQTYPGGIVRKDTLNASGKAVTARDRWFSGARGSRSRSDSRRPTRSAGCRERGCRRHP
ncbi:MULTISPECIES: hypothetical protein [unclassified Kitasatospora]|uniref:hypothetical protein n=1 Tax=unclassified Kitasatospora TaxID=2633591 RepID=UPI0033C9B1CE